MKIAIAQIDPVVGAFESNVKTILEFYERACQAQARLLLTPELSLCGYPPHDLAERPEMTQRTQDALAKLMAATKGKSCALVVGHVASNPGDSGKAALNQISVLQDGRVVFEQAKTLLPTYDVFDEARYFQPAHEIKLWECDGRKIAIGICEDLWASDPALGRRIYGKDPVDIYKQLGAQILVSISSSPYEQGKRGRREAVHAEIARALKVPLLYCNQYGANDEILFDGASFALTPAGDLAGRLQTFGPAFAVFEIAKKGEIDSVTLAGGEIEAQDPSELESLSRGLVIGIRDYFAKTGFKTAILGLSGGIDSAVVAALACKALGPENVLGVAMPSQFSSSHSLADAEESARLLGCRFEVRPIKFLNATALRDFSERRGQLNSVAQENLQARLRGLLLMTLSNNDGALLLTTGNKSEIAMGYATLYGDMCGAIAPIGDIFKTRVYELARYLNQAWGRVIPDSSITKPPSAELRPGQTDQDSLPPYAELDEVLEAYVERGQEVGDKYPWAPKVVAQLELQEYKRRQAAPVLKVSSRAFGSGRRMPIAKKW